MNSQGDRAIDEEGESFDWGTLVPLFAHPTKVALIEAMVFIGRPLSASGSMHMFDCKWNLSCVSYHMTSLAKAGVLTKVGEQRRRGAMESYYYFPPEPYFPAEEGNEGEKRAA
ncbi:MAG TPA: hypothetical protein VII45_13495 [Solirubrobacterales bacterium]